MLVNQKSCTYTTFINKKDLQMDLCTYLHFETLNEVVLSWILFYKLRQMN